MTHKAILIDSTNKTFKVVEIENFRDIQKQLDCRVFTIATVFEKNEDTLYVDDEGLLTNPQHFFEYEDAHQPFAGKGLLIGCDDEGEDKDVQTSMEEVQSKVKFYSLAEIRAKIL